MQRLTSLCGNLKEPLPPEANPRCLPGQVVHGFCSLLAVFAAALMVFALIFNELWVVDYKGSQYVNGRHPNVTFDVTMTMGHTTLCVARDLLIGHFTHLKDGCTASDLPCPFGEYTGAPARYFWVTLLGSLATVVLIVCGGAWFAALKAEEEKRPKVMLVALIAAAVAVVLLAPTIFFARTEPPEVECEIAHGLLPGQGGASGAEGEAAVRVGFSLDSRGWGVGHSAVSVAENFVSRVRLAAAEQDGEKDGDDAGEGEKTPVGPPPVLPAFLEHFGIATEAAGPAHPLWPSVEKPTKKTPTTLCGSKTVASALTSLLTVGYLEQDGPVLMKGGPLKGPGLIGEPQCETAVGVTNLCLIAVLIMAVLMLVAAVIVRFVARTHEFLYEVKRKEEVKVQLELPINRDILTRELRLPDHLLHADYADP